MKLILKIISLSIVTLVLGFTTIFLTKAESITEEGTTLISDRRVDMIIHYNNTEIIEQGGVILINDFTIKGTIKDYVILDKDIYILINDNKNYIYKISDNKLIKSVEVLMSNPRTLCIYQDMLLLGGSNNNQMCITIYNNLLDKNNEILYNTKGFTECVKMIVLDGYLYIGGIKDAIFESDIFKNVGSKDEIKSFIFKLDSSYRLVKDGYFNELLDNEQIYDMFVYQNMIGVILRTNKDNQYLLDINLNIKDYTSINKNSHYIKTNKTIDEGIVYISEKSEYFSLEAVVNNKYQSIMTIDGEYLNYYFYEGEVYIYYIEDEKTYVKWVNEYHIDYLKTLYCDYYDYDETTKNHFKVGSYLEDLDFEIKEISPYFVKNKGGKYEITYLSSRENGDEIQIKTPLIISEYVNVQDGQIYPKGYQLFYFGDATLNGKPINNGTILSDVGVNHLVITNGNNETFTYEITVIDGYYKNSFIPSINIDFRMNQKETLYIPLGKKEVESVVINNKEIGNIQKVNNEYYFTFSYEINKNLINIGTQAITINKINYCDGTSSDVNLRFILLVEKEEPYLEIKETKVDNHLNLFVNIADYDQAIIDLEVEVYQNNKLVKTGSTYLKNTKNLIDNLELDSSFEVYFKLITENNSYNILYYKGVMTKDKPINYEVEFEYDESCLKTINLDIDLSSDKIEHEILKLGNDTFNLNSKYQVTKNKTFIYVSIIVSIIILGVIGILLIRKLKKKKVTI